MTVLITLIITWLSSNFDLPATYEHPSVQLVPSQQLVVMRFGAIASAGGSQPLAVYHDRSRTIYLSDDWTGTTPAELSVLVHEVVHHLQNMSKLTYQCAAARETLAYAAQEKWLRLFGRSLESEFEIDPMTLKIATACM